MSSPCGTYGGYKRHVSRGQVACEACALAKRDYERVRTGLDPSAFRVPDMPELPQALCREIDPELWFPEGTANGRVLSIREARAMCARCPEKDPCLAYALSFPATSLYGIWAGTDMEERRQMRAERRSA